MPRLCHNCHADLPPREEGVLSFCAHCGAPQVLLSEELQAQPETVASGTEPEAKDAEPRSEVWAVALRCVAVAAALAAVLELASLSLPPVVFFVWLWSVVSPVVVIGMFRARSPLSPLTTGFGARLGLVTGLGVGLALSIVNTAAMFTARRLHHMGDFDLRLNVAIEQVKAQLAAQPGGGATEFGNALAVPEFRAGMLLLGGAMLMTMLVVLSTAGGAFAGYAWSRKRA